MRHYNKKINYFISLAAAKVAKTPLYFIFLSSILNYAVSGGFFRLKNYILQILLHKFFKVFRSLLNLTQKIWNFVFWSANLAYGGLYYDDVFFFPFGNYFICQSKN